MGLVLLHLHLLTNRSYRSLKTHVGFAHQLGAFKQCCPRQLLGRNGKQNLRGIAADGGEQPGNHDRRDFLGGDRVPDFSDQSVVGLWPHRRYLRPSNSLRTRAGCFRNWRAAMRSLPKRDAAHPVSIIPGSGRFHDFQSQARALAMDSLPKESSGKAQGFMTTAFHTGVLIGPSAGGFIIEYISWRAVFFFVPIALAGAVLSLFHRSKVETSTHAKSNTSQSAVDYLGAVLLVGATVGLIAVVDHRIMEAAGRQMQVGLIAGFVVFFLAFLYRESSTSSPILDLSLFRIRMFSISSLSLLLVGVAQVMIGFVLPFYLQDILHLSPSFMGLLFVSAPVFTVTLSPVVGWVTDKVGPRLPATVGISFLVAAAFLGSFLRTDSHWIMAVLVLALWGLATAMLFPPDHTAMTAPVPVYIAA